MSDIEFLQGGGEASPPPLEPPKLIGFMCLRWGKNSTFVLANKVEPLFFPHLCPFSHTPESLPKYAENIA